MDNKIFLKLSIIHYPLSIIQILFWKKRIADVKKIVVEAGVFDSAIAVWDVIVFVADGYGAFVL